MPQKDTLYGDLFVVGSLEANLIKKTGGTSSQFLKADGSVDSNTYLTSVPTLAQVTTAGNTTTNAINTGLITTTTSTVGNMLVVNGANNTSVRVLNDSFGRATIEVKGNPSATGQAGAYFNADGYEEAWFNVIARQASTGNKYWRFGNLGLQNYFAIQKLTDTGSTISTIPFVIFSSTNNVVVGSTTSVTDAGYKLDVLGTGKFSDKLRVGTGTFTDSSAFLIVNPSSGTASRGVLAGPGNYQDFGMVNTSVASGNINAWGFGQRRDTYFGNTLGSFQIVGSYTDNTGLGVGVGGGFRVPLICNPNGDLILVGASANAVNGNVGIGTTSLSTKLEVVGTHVSGIGIARFKGDAQFGFMGLDTTTAGGESGFLVSLAGTLTGQFGVNGANNSVYIKNRVYGTSDVLTIYSTGNVAINTTTDSGYKLDVNGTFRVSGVSTLGQIVINGGTQAKSYVDISSSLPAFRLWSADYSTFYGGFGSSTWAGSTGNDPAILASTGLGIKFLVNGGTTPSMIVNSSGNVGIGTTSPAYKLDVVGNIALSGNLVPTSGTSTVGTFANRFTDFWGSGLIVGTTFYGDNHQSASGTLYFKDGGGTEKMRMTSGGNFLIGTGVDAGYKLLVNGTVKAGITRLGYVSTYTDSNAALYVGNAVSGSNSAKLIIDPYEADNLYYKLVLESTFYAAQPFQLYSSNVQTWLYGYASGMLYQPHAMKIPTQISMGTTSVASNEISGSVLFIHGENYYAQPAFIRMTSYSTGIANTRGVVMGLWTGDNLRFWNYENTAINIGTNNVERITVLGNGNVGISNTSPAYKLDVVGDINTSTGFRVGGAAGWTGTINIVGNPPGQQNIQVSGGIIVNVY